MTQRPFDTFILLAEMRTGSNFLEQTLNLADGVHCWGEAFNPHFVGHAGQNEMAGVTMAEREADPSVLLRAMTERTDGVAGFRFFHDHDHRILERLVPDPRCAKIILTRNLLDSYVSLKIARVTNQWRLNDMKNAKSAQIAYDPAEFASHTQVRNAFRSEVETRLKRAGQVAFHVRYEDLGDLETINGLLSWLGVAPGLERLSRSTKVQNPLSLEEKVSNYDRMVAHLSGGDPFDVTRLPDFEPVRGAMVPNYVMARSAPLLFLPVPGGPDTSIEAWFDGLGDGEPPARAKGQKDMRKWLRLHPGRRSFSVLRHPVPRLYRTFCRRILWPGPDCQTDVRETLRRHYGLPIPPVEEMPDLGVSAHRAAFLSFAGFVAGNLGGQTSIRVDPAWASQQSLLQGIARFLLPDMLIREEEAPLRLAELSASLGLSDPGYVPETDTAPVALDAIYDEEVETAIRRVYRRDYVMLGFADWR